jgi:NADPH:quinone reductase-like Zn-dependent oxidoreductase
VVLSEYRRVLNPHGALMMVGGPNNGRWIRPLSGSIKAILLVGRFITQRFVFMLAKLNQGELGVLRNLMRAEKLTPVIDRRYKLSETAKAIRYLEEGRARGKVLITLK